MDADLKYLHSFLFMFSCVRNGVTKCPFWSWVVTKCLHDGFTPTESCGGRSPQRTLLGLRPCAVPEQVSAGFYCSQPRPAGPALPCYLQNKIPRLSTSQGFLHVQNIGGVTELEILVPHSRPEGVHFHGRQQRQRPRRSHREACEPGRR